MKSPPDIVVEFVHILGPMKGEIQDFAEGYIAIGRHPSCAIRFPADLVDISRKHAEIIREGNQFKLIDLSTNGTFINGKKVKEAFLKDGDVVELAAGGPKLSFLTKHVDGQVNFDAVMPKNVDPQIIPEVVVQSSSASEKHQVSTAVDVAPAQSAIESRGDLPQVQIVTVPLVIQYGPTIRSFKQVPVTIGKNSQCDLVISHPALLDKHAQFFFHQNQYWIKDLTGKHLIRLNNKQIDVQSPLNSNDEISLSPQGPLFCFLGEGRLAEMATPDTGGSQTATNGMESSAGKNGGSEGDASDGFWSKLKRKI